MTTVASPTLSPTWLTMTPDRHADTVILRSLPGVGVVLAGRMLSEFEDDPTRFTDAASRRGYAGTAPITKASGKRPCGVDATGP
jgi:transposase